MNTWGNAWGFEFLNTQDYSNMNALSSASEKTLGPSRHKKKKKKNQPFPK